ncbi:hypothetical protein GH714_010774 [Hevea brasiliensis]|uniref:Uncharacterized protein n=1 Tax=Hevea brasiliensis TaxID=3981 RepID=A0A6A6K3W9_HEVBR|nr:hypothetical protein GH714_010774 [Hevea brasiliensis]
MKKGYISSLWDFGTMRSQILNSESMTDIDRIYAQAIREERHNTIIASLEAKPFKATAFHASGSRYVKDPNEPSCSHCGKLVPQYFSDAIITDETPHMEPRERMSTSRVESTQHTPEMNAPRSEVDLKINIMTHGETEAMTSYGVVDHELEIAPHGEHGVTNENEEKEDELQEQVRCKAKTSKKNAREA